MIKRKSNSYLSIQTAFIKLTKNIINKPINEELDAKETLGRVLYNNIISSVNIPMYDSSHMDGFAVIHDDLIGSTNLKPITLKVIDDIKLGNSKIKPLQSGYASRIPTGGYLPKNSDTVVPIEYVQFNSFNKSVKIFSELSKGTFITPAGKNISKKKLILKKGHLIRIQDIALLNLLGLKKINVFKKPKVAIIPTGSELTNNIDDVIQYGKILNTNGKIISLLIEAAGGIPIDLGITSDDIQTIKKKIKDAISQNDVIVTIGGSSVGHKDLIADSIHSMGKPGILAEGIKLDRGRVTKIARLKSTPIIILPGPIQGAVNACIALVIPLIRKLIGLSHNNNKAIDNAQITDNWIARKKFQNFVKILYVHLSISKFDNTINAEPIIGETADMTVMTKANGYVIIPEKITNIEKGTEIQVNLLSGLSFASTNPIDFI